MADHRVETPRRWSDSVLNARHDHGPAGSNGLHSGFVVIRTSPAAPRERPPDAMGRLVGSLGANGADSQIQSAPGQLVPLSGDR